MTVTGVDGDTVQHPNQTDDLQLGMSPTQSGPGLFNAFLAIVFG